MAFSSYLNEFPTKLSSIQTRQILRLIQEKKDNGGISSLEELKAELQSLTTKLLAEEIVPSLSREFFPAVPGELISSEKWNFMMRELEDDLTAALEELSTIEEVLTAHQRIVEQVVLKTLHLAINELDEQITLHEIVAGSDLGLSHGQRNHFNTADPLMFAGNALVDPAGHCLTLPTTSENTAVLLNTASVLEDEDTTATEVLGLSTDPSAILDQKKGTFWLREILLSNPKSSVSQKVRIEFNGIQDFNQIVVDPAAPFPVQLSKIEYEDSSGTVIDTGLASLSNPVSLGHGIKIFTGRVTARAILLSLIQNNYTEVYLPTSVIPPVETHLRDLLSSQGDLSLLGLSKQTSPTHLKRYYKYVFGLDNIFVQIAQYGSEGSFIARSFDSSEAPTILVLQTEEDIPESSGMPIGSLEYEVVKKNWDSSGRLLNVDRFAIPSFDSTDQTHERLDIDQEVMGSEEKNAGVLRFPVDCNTEMGSMTATGGYTPLIYRDGQLLRGPFETSPEWYFLSEEDSPLTNTTPYSSRRMSQAIYLTSPSSTSIYTVTYRPLVGDSHHKLPPSPVLDYDTNLFTVSSLSPRATARLSPRSSIYCSTELDGERINYSTLSLIVTLRHNDLTRLDLTPRLLGYTLLVGSAKLTNNA